MNRGASQPEQQLGIHTEGQISRQPDKKQGSSNWENWGNNTYNIWSYISPMNENNGETGGNLDRDMVRYDEINNWLSAWTNTIHVLEKT
jgi:hypothetical protein